MPFTHGADEGLSVPLFAYPALAYGFLFSHFIHSELSEDFTFFSR